MWFQGIIDGNTWVWLGYLFVTEGAGVFRPLNGCEFLRGLQPRRGYFGAFWLFGRTKERPVAKAALIESDFQLAAASEDPCSLLNGRSMPRKE